MVEFIGGLRSNAYSDVALLFGVPRARCLRRPQKSRQRCLVLREQIRRSLVEADILLLGCIHGRCGGVVISNFKSCSSLGQAAGIVAGKAAHGSHHRSLDGTKIRVSGGLQVQKCRVDRRSVGFLDRGQCFQLSRNCTTLCSATSRPS